jgi:hypothetical protein
VRVDAEAFKSHVATHQEELAVLALPASAISSGERIWAGLKCPSDDAAIDQSKLDKIFPPSSWTARMCNRGDDPFDPQSWRGLKEAEFEEELEILPSGWRHKDDKKRSLSPSFLSPPEFRDAGRHRSRSKVSEPARVKSLAIPPPGQGSRKPKVVPIWICVSPGSWAGNFDSELTDTPDSVPVQVALAHWEKREPLP